LHDLFVPQNRIFEPVLTAINGLCLARARLDAPSTSA
jgi:hypothetical protein